MLSYREMPTHPIAKMIYLFLLSFQYNAGFSIGGDFASFLSPGDLWQCLKSFFIVPT